MAIPPVSGSPHPKKAEEPKKVGGEESKTPNVKELASKLIIPMGSKPAPIKKAIQEAPSEEPGRPIEDTGIHLPPPPRQGRPRMALPGENPPPSLADAVKAKTAPAELGPLARPAVRGMPKKPAPTVTAPKTYTPMKAVLADLGENRLFKKQQELHNPRQADKFLHDLALEHGHLFHEASGVFINTKTEKIVSADEFRAIVADTSGNYDRAVKLHEEWDAPTSDTHEEFSAKQETTLESVQKMESSTPLGAERYLRSVAIHYGYEFRSDFGGVFQNFTDDSLIDAKQFAAVMFGKEVLTLSLILGNCGMDINTKFAGPVPFEKLSSIGQTLEDYRIATNRYVSGLKRMGLGEMVGRSPSVIERAARKGYVVSLEGFFIKSSGKDLGEIKRNKDFL